MGTVSKYRFGDFEADLKAAELRRHGTRLKLQLQPFQVLVALLERPKDVVTREELQQRLWPQDTFVDFDHGLNTAMVKLRDVLGDSAANPKYIETIAKRGYRFLGDVTVTPDLSAAVLPQPAKEPVSTSPETELPRASRGTARILFSLSQIMYLIFYLCALFNLDQLYRAASAAWRGAGHIVFAVCVVTALVGVAVRLYLLSATAMDYHLLGEKYRVLFPALFALDMLWALSPFLIYDRLGLGLALGSAAALIYMPFVQRVLMKMMGRSR
jgi:cholera toxin transcriptional activator